MLSSTFNCSYLFLNLLVAFSPIIIHMITNPTGTGQLKQPFCAVSHVFSASHRNWSFLEADLSFRTQKIICSR